MELIITDIHSQGNIKLITDLARRLGLKATKLPTSEKEEIALASAIDEGRKSGYVDEADLMKMLRQIQEK